MYVNCSLIASSATYSLVSAYNFLNVNVREHIFKIKFYLTSCVIVVVFAVVNLDCANLNVCKEIISNSVTVNTNDCTLEYSKVNDVDCAVTVYVT